MSTMEDDLEDRCALTNLDLRVHFLLLPSIALQSLPYRQPYEYGYV